jgi:hypothetical protein
MPTPAGPEYRVQLFQFVNSSTFGIGPLLAEFDKAKNIGWALYINDVPEAFFTIDQDDPKLKLLRGYEGRCHVRILRNTDVVWAGWGAMEHDATFRDAVFTCYGYIGGTFFLPTDWDVQYNQAQIDSIVSDAWTRAKTGISQSPLNFVTTGTIQAPVTTSGGATPIVLPIYSAFYKRILFLLREMAALSHSDTTNTVQFEITHSTTPTFNFWKNKGSDIPAAYLQLGDDKIKDFRDLTQAIYRRNQIVGVGAAPNNALLRYQWTSPDGSELNNYGARVEPVYLRWVRDQTELQRALSLRGALAQRNLTDLQILLHPNVVLPPGATGNLFGIGDRIWVKIDRGIVNVNNYYQVTGVQVLFMKKNETTKLLLQQKSGS